MDHIVEQDQRLSRSILWQLQRRYFSQQGIDAWRAGAVPQYITSNAFIARAYARVVLGFLRDWAAGLPEPERPILIVELGAGSGRFAFHFLKRFLPLLRASPLAHVRVQYVMTDFAEATLAYWSDHPSLRPFVEQGVLDFACFDVERDDSLTLRHAGATLRPQVAANPIVALANYVFDSIPHDAFAIRDGRLYESLVSVLSDQPEADPADPSLLGRLETTYHDQPVALPYYDDPDLDRILAEYGHSLADTSLLFPCAAIRALRAFQRLGGGRLLLLAGDKGYHREEDLLGRGEPGLNFHGSFSLTVNFHAVGQYVRHQGGEALHTAHRPAGLDVAAYLLGGPAAGYRETRLAFREAVEEGGPDDFYWVKTAVEPHYNELTLEQMLAWLRLGGDDAGLLQGCLPALLRLAKTATNAQKQELYLAVRQVWEGYFPIGEEADLAFSLGMLLYGLGYFLEALEFFDHSLQLYGPNASTFYNMALCHYELRQLEQALGRVHDTLAINPEFELAKGARIRFQAELARRR